MREIKFRQPFYTYEGKFAGFMYWGHTAPGEFRSPGMKTGCNSKADEQYTGLKDRNGREIYEGDIYRRFNYIYIVEWVDCGFKGRIIGRKQDFGDEYESVAITGAFRSEYYHIETNDGVLEIIGNIHENPELIRKTEKA